MIIYVASTNIVKVSAVKFAFQQRFPKAKEVKVYGFACDSGVSPQPFNEQTLIGCENRLVALEKQVGINDWDYLVAIENGLFESLIEDEDDKEKFIKIYYDDCYILIKNKKQKITRLSCHPENDSITKVSSDVYHLIKVKEKPLSEYYQNINWHVVIHPEKKTRYELISEKIMNFEEKFN